MFVDLIKSKGLWGVSDPFLDGRGDNSGLNIVLINLQAMEKDTHKSRN